MLARVIIDSMIRAETKTQAFALFLEGYSLRKVADLCGIARSTTMRWSTQEGWVKKRCEHHNAILDEIRKNQLGERVKRSQLICDKANDIFLDLYADYIAFRSGKIRRRKYNASLLQIVKMAPACLEIGLQKAELIRKKQMLAYQELNNR